MTDAKILRQALAIAHTSNDPNTKVGAVIVTPDGLFATGFNRFPSRIAADERMANREFKLATVIHAEMDAMIQAGDIYGATIYMAAMDNTGEVWGGNPCSECCKHLIHAGIRRVVSYPRKRVSKWADSIAFGRRLLDEAGVEVVELRV